MCSRSRSHLVLLTVIVVGAVVFERVRFYFLLFHSFVGIPRIYESNMSGTHTIIIAATIARVGDGDDDDDYCTGTPDSSSTLCVTVEKAGPKLASYQNQSSKAHATWNIFASNCAHRTRCEQAATVCANVLPSYFVIISKPPSNLFKLASIPVKCKRWWWKTRKRKRALDRELDENIYVWQK